jgi:hypothetical protein
VGDDISVKIVQVAEFAPDRSQSLEDKPPISMRCGVNFAFWDVAMAMGALLFPPAALIFGLTGIAVAIAGAFVCD